MNARPKVLLVTVGSGGILIGALGVIVVGHRATENKLSSAVPLAILSGQSPTGSTSSPEPIAKQTPVAPPTIVPKMRSAVASGVADKASKAAPYDFGAMSGRDSRNALAAQMTSESQDLDWAPKASQTIEHLIQSEPGFTNFPNLQVDCRSTLCRVSIVGDQALIAPDGAKYNPQVMFAQFNSDSAYQAMFDDQTVWLGTDEPTGLGRLDFYIHRREKPP
jgi:hypothetical protein